MVDLEKLEALEKAATKGPWYVEAVSDAVRICIGKGRQKWILARLATKQIPEAETTANAQVLTALRNAAPELIAELRELRALKAYINGHALSIDLPIGEWVRGVSKCSASEAVEDSIKQSPVEGKVDR